MKPKCAYAGRCMDAARMQFRPFSNAKCPRCGALLGLSPLQTYNNQTMYVVSLSFCFSFFRSFLFFLFFFLSQSLLFVSAPCSAPTLFTCREQQLRETVFSNPPGSTHEKFILSRKCDKTDGRNNVLRGFPLFLSCHAHFTEIAVNY